MIDWVEIFALSSFQFLICPKALRGCWSDGLTHAVLAPLLFHVLGGPNIVEEIGYKYISDLWCETSSVGPSYGLFKHISMLTGSEEASASNKFDFLFLAFLAFPDFTSLL